jgi:hypothetical protein
MGKEKKDTRPEVVTLPSDFTDKLPPKAKVMLYDMDIFDNCIARFDIGWSASHARIIIPIYKYLLPTNGGPAAKKLVGFMGRKLDGVSSDTDKNKPKWWTVRQKDIKHPRFIALPTVSVAGKHVVIVEDIFSAIKVAKAGHLSIALMTTYLPYELYPVLRDWHATLWLDADAYDKAVKYQTSLGQAGCTADVVYSDKDPKWYSTDQINEAIKNGKI